MRWILLVATMASVALASCVKDESLDLAQQAKKLSFATPVMGTQSRADVTGEIYGTGYPENEEFAVYAVQHNGNLTTWDAAAGFWTNDKTTPITVTKEGNGWEDITTKDYYWPKASNENVKLSFAAYSPAVLPTGTASYGATGLTIADYTVNDVVANQIDLMYAERVLNRTEPANDATGVSIVFKHALSSIVFAAVDNDNAASYQITSIKVNGTFKVTETFNETVTDGAAYSSAPAWSSSSTAVAKEYEIWTGTYDVDGTTAKEFTGGNTASLPKTALLFIPQNAPDDATVTITYKRDVQYGEDNTYTITKYLKDFKNVSTPISTWKIGERYIYTFQFGGTKKIFFSPSVDGWDDQTAVSVEI